MAGKQGGLQDWVVGHRLGIMKACGVVYAAALYLNRDAISRNGVIVGSSVAVIGLLIRLSGIMHRERLLDQKLVIDGPYRRSRHPRYWGTFIVAVGAAWLLNWLPVAACLLAVVAGVHILTAGKETTRLGVELGREFEAYRESVSAVLSLAPEPTVARPGRNNQPFRASFRRRQLFPLLVSILACIFAVIAAMQLMNG